MYSRSIAIEEEQEAKASQVLYVALPPRQALYCEITNLNIKMRHPVLLSDGRHYELLTLVTFFRAANNTRSPVTREVTVSAIYDLDLKGLLDRSFGNTDRHQDYDSLPLLQELQQMLSPLNPAYQARLAVARARPARDTGYQLFGASGLSRLKKLILLPLLIYFIADIGAQSEEQDHFKSYATGAFQLLVIGMVAERFLSLFQADFMEDFMLPSSSDETEDELPADHARGVGFGFNT